MADSILVDTSAWIISFRRIGYPDLKDFLKSILASGLAATCPVVILELLQGCRTEAERDRLRAHLESLQVFPILESTWDQAYELGFLLARKGVTIPTADLLIAATALQNQAAILHHDQHFNLIAQYTELRTRSFS